MKRRILSGIAGIALCILFGTSCKEEGIYFTENEVVGDIITETEYRLENNTLVIPYNAVKSVNIRGSKGNCTVVSSDGESVIPEVYNGYRKSISISVLKTEGTATITVCDEDGQTATLEIVATSRNIPIRDFPLPEAERFLGGTWELVRIGIGETGTTAPVNDVFWELSEEGCYRIFNPATEETVAGCEAWVKKTTFKGYDAPFIGDGNLWVDCILNDTLRVYENSDKEFSFALVRREYVTPDNK